MNFMFYSNFLKKLTVRKIVNFFKLWLSYWYSIISKSPNRLAFPYSISIEPTNYCNLACPQCPTGLGWLKREKGFLDFELYKKIIDQAHPYLLNLFLYFMGEPLLHKQIHKFIKYANQKNIFTGLATNAQLLTPQIAEKIIKAQLDYIIISIDGTTEQSYQFYRKQGSLTTAIQNIETLQNLKSKFNTHKPFLILQFLIHKQNENQIIQFKKLAKNLKADFYQIKTMQIINFETAHLYLPKNPKYSRYKLENGKFKLKRKLKNRCWRLWNSVVITWDGYVLPCCYDKDAKYKLGNIKYQTLKQIINNQNFKNFAKKVLTNRASIDICSNCNE